MPLRLRDLVQLATAAVTVVTGTIVGVGMIAGVEMIADAGTIAGIETIVGIVKTMSNLRRFQSRSRCMVMDAM